MNTHYEPGPQVKVPSGYPRAGRRGWIVSGSRTEKTVDIAIKPAESRTSFKNHKAAIVTVNIEDMA